MEFKTIAYVIIGVLWLLSRFFQKQKDGRSEEADTGQIPPIQPAETSRQPAPRSTAKPGSSRNQTVKKPRAIGRQEQFPPAISLEVQANSPGPVQNVRLHAKEPDTPAETVLGSEAERISEEIRNGQMDWKRAVIISELINKRSGF